MDKIILFSFIIYLLISSLSISNLNLLVIYCSTASFSFLYNSYFLCYELICLYWRIPVTKRIEDIIITADNNTINPNPNSLSASNTL